MDQKSRLTRSIAVTVAALLAFQLLLTLVITLVFRLPWGRAVFFLVLVAAYHGLLLWVMVGLRRLFVLIESGEQLARVNVSNVLSTARLSSLPTILYLILSSRDAALVPVILPYVIVIFLTDLLDGRLARRRGEITRMGRYLDAFSDYLVLSATLFAFLWFGLISFWFFVLVVIRLAVVTGGNTAVHFLQGYVEPKTSFLGKASIFSIMVLFAAKVLEIPYRLTFPDSRAWVVQGIEKLELMVAGVLIVSVVEKIGLVGRDIREASRQRRDGRA